MSRAVVRSADQTSERSVKNLGWLRRHWKEVARFEVGNPLPVSYPEGRPDCILVALLHDGRTFRCAFESREVCREWIHRPVFRGLPLKWFGAVVCVC